jgi:hypothetical protein
LRQKIKQSECSIYATSLLVQRCQHDEQNVPFNAMCGLWCAPCDNVARLRTECRYALKTVGAKGSGRRKPTSVERYRRMKVVARRGDDQDVRLFLYDIRRQPPPCRSMKRSTVGSLTTWKQQVEKQERKNVLAVGAEVPGACRSAAVEAVSDASTVGIVRWPLVATVGERNCCSPQTLSGCWFAANGPSPFLNR